MKPSAALLTLLLGSFAFAGPVHADARADLKDAYTRFIQATSFRATLSDLDKGKEVSLVEFALPDRYAVTPAAGGPRQIIIGRTMYMDLGGQVMKIPLPPQADPNQYRNPRALEELAAGIAVEQRADAVVAGEPAKVYYFLSNVDGKPMETLTFVSKARGLPIQVQTTAGKTRGKFRYQIRYSHFNDPAIVINTPN